MARIDLEVVGQREQLLVDAGEQLARFSRARPGRSGRPTAPTNSVSPVSTNQARARAAESLTRRQMLSGVWPGVWSTLTRCCRDRAPGRRERREGRADIGGALVQAVLRAGASRRVRAAGPMVRVHVRVDHVRDLMPLAAANSQ